MMSGTSRTPLRVVGFEGFDGGSHRLVRVLIARHSRHDWTWLTRPARAWKWGMRTGAIELATQATGPTPDLLFVTSLLSASDLRAMLPGAWRAAPLVVYMHENQAAYPTAGTGAPPEASSRDAHFALTNLTSLLAADRVLWNSRWNLTSFLDGMRTLLRHAPVSAAQVDEWLGQIERRSTVTWPPVEDPQTLHNPGRTDNNGRSDAAGGAVRVVWPHRWEHDKGPDELLDLARRHTTPLNLRWVILGESFDRVPDAMRMFLDEFHDHIDHAGFIESRDDYLAMLTTCDWVLSTARHEFFGVAVVEAMLAGALPWLPARLSYPELLPDELRGITPLAPPTDAAAARVALRRHLALALAPAAVERIDDELTTVVSSDGPVAQKGVRHA